MGEKIRELQKKWSSVMMEVSSSWEKRGKKAGKRPSCGFGEMRELVMGMHVHQTITARRNLGSHALQKGLWGQPGYKWAVRLLLRPRGDTFLVA